MKYNWNYGENDCQNYYEVNNGKEKEIESNYNPNQRIDIYK